MRIFKGQHARLVRLVQENMQNAGITQETTMPACVCMTHARMQMDRLVDRKRRREALHPKDPRRPHPFLHPHVR